MSPCGRCRGRGYIQPIRGIGQIDCPVCKGLGVKPPAQALGRTSVSVPLPPGSRCKVCGDLAVHQHHVIAQQRLNRYLPEDIRRQAKADVRNTVPLCFECHHRVEVGPLPLELNDLHPAFARFVAEYDLAAALPRHLAGVIA